MQPSHEVHVPPPAPLGWITLAVVGWCVAGIFGYLWQQRPAAELAPRAELASDTASGSSAPPPSLDQLTPSLEPQPEEPIPAAEHQAEVDELRLRIADLEAENAGLETDLERSREETRAYRNGAQRAVDLLNRDRRQAEQGRSVPRSRPSPATRPRANVVVHRPYVTLDEAGCFCARIRGEVTNIGKAAGSGEVVVELLAGGEVVDSTTAYIDLSPEQRKSYAVEFDLVGEGPYSARAYWDG